MTGFWEQLSGGPSARAPLTIRGRLTDRTGGTDHYETVTLDHEPPAFNNLDYLPSAAALTVFQPSRTEVDLTWTPGPQTFPQSTVTSWKIFRNQDSAGAVLVATVDDDVLTYNDTGLATNTPEIVWTYIVTAVNADGERNSNSANSQWSGTVLSQPTAPTNLSASSVQDTSVVLSWSETTDATVTKHGLFNGTTLVVNNIPANTTSFQWSGLTASTTYSNMTIRRYNGWTGGTVPGWSPASNAINVTTHATAGSPLFLGDVPGKAYMGWIVNVNDNLYKNQLDTQTPFNPARGVNSGTSYSSLLGIRRVFSKSATPINEADASNRVVWLSAKGPDLGASSGTAGWAQVASGSQDSNIVSYFSSVVARNKLTIFTFHHEPMGDAATAADGTTYANAHKRIKQVVNTNYPGHRILFCPNYEEYRLTNPYSGQDWARWLPEEMMPGVNSYSWDFISYDTYQTASNTSTNPTAGVQFSHRFFRMVDILSGSFRPTGTSVMPYMTYTPGVDIRIGWGEVASWPYYFYAFENNIGNKKSNMTGAKYARDMIDTMLANMDKIFCVCWYNQINGQDHVAGDTRLWPSDTALSTANGEIQPNHPSLVQQTGDTEYQINVWREFLISGFAVKLANNGLPPT